MKFLVVQFSWIWFECFQSNVIHSKIFQSDWILRSYSLKFIAHQAFRNAVLNLTLVAARTIRFICSKLIMDSAKESRGYACTGTTVKVATSKVASSQPEKIQALYKIQTLAPLCALCTCKSSALKSVMIFKIIQFFIYSSHYFMIFI